VASRLHSISLGFTSVGDTGIQVLVCRLSRRCHCTRSMVLVCPVDMYVVTREGAPISFDDSRVALKTRSKILARMPLYTYVDSRDDAQSTGARLTILEFHVLVSPVVVRVCRFCVYCAGSPPPGTVICAVFNLWRLFSLLPWSSFTALLGAFVVCMCKWLCVCRCRWWSCAGTVHSQFHMLYEYTFQVFRGIVRLLVFCTFMFLFCVIFFSSLQCMILLRESSCGLLTTFWW
jgi:hypothetical protein